MKQSIRLIAFLISFLPSSVFSQWNFKKGVIITASGEKIEGSISPSFKINGKLTFLSGDNNKQTYKPFELKAFTVDSINYFSYSNDFYEELSTGPKATLYKKITDNSDERVYNGSEAVGFTKTTEGSKGAFYLRCGEEIKLDLIIRKIFKNYFARLFEKDEKTVSKIKDGRLDYGQLKNVVELYNSQYGSALSQ